MLLASCGDGYFHESKAANIKQFVYVIPDGFSGDVTSFLRPVIETQVELGQSIRFSAQYTINGDFISNDEAADIYRSLLWEIDGEYFNIDLIRYTFKKPGIIHGKLMTIDDFQDTLVTEFIVQVNTPESFTLDFPYDGYNQAEPSKYEDLPFRWTISGLDAWETAQCEVFLSPEELNVWKNKIGSTDCLSEANLWGPIVGDSALLHDMGIDIHNTSYTFYWGVKYTVFSNGSPRSENYSSINHFVTKFQNESISRLRVPLKYKNYGAPSSLNTTAYIVASNGDTLKTYTGTAAKQEILLNLKPQMGVKVYFSEESRKEYTADSITVDLPPGTEVTTDTVFFTDKTNPQITTFNMTFHSKRNAEFILYDDGSGVNPETIKVLVDNDEREFEVQDFYLRFNPLCVKSCLISIQAEDYAQNKIPNIHWKITRDNTGYYQLEGPIHSAGGSL